MSVNPAHLTLKTGRVHLPEQEIDRQSARSRTDTKAFEVALKNALRQAPDVILIGEIRDKQTMGMARLRASGHLAVATLHANNSYHAMNRVINFYPLENRPSLLLDMAAALQAVISQRLVRTKSGARVAASRCCSTRAISRS